MSSVWYPGICRAGHHRSRFSWNPDLEGTTATKREPMVANVGDLLNFTSFDLRFASFVVLWTRLKTRNMDLPQLRDRCRTAEPLPGNQRAHDYSGADLVAMTPSRILLLRKVSDWRRRFGPARQLRARGNVFTGEQPPYTKSFPVRQSKLTTDALW